MSGRTAPCLLGVQDKCFALLDASPVVVVCCTLLISCFVIYLSGMDRVVQFTSGITFD